MAPRKKTEKKPVFKPQRAVKLTEGSAKARRTAARLAAVQVLYQMDQNDQNARTVIREFIDHRIGFEVDGEVLVPADAELLSEIVNGVEARRNELVEMISAAADKTEFTKMELLLRCILLCGAWELLDNTDVDKGIVINDYLNVTNAFYEKSERGLINAILDRLAGKLR